MADDQTKAKATILDELDDDSTISEVAAQVKAAAADHSSWRVVAKYKYLVVVVLGLLSVGLLSDASVLRLLALDSVRAELTLERDGLLRELRDADKKMDGLRKSGDVVEQVAREQYYMKKADEDIYVLSTDVD